MRGVNFMNKVTTKILIIAIWTCLLMLLFKKGIITTNIGKIREILKSNPTMMMEIFVLISIGRVLFFLPGVVFVFLGGLCFGPVVGFTLSMVSIIISETIIYIIGRYFAGERLNRYINKNHRDLVLLTAQHGYEFLSLGILCPIISSDVVCLISAMLNSNYKKYILTVILANTPMMLLYSHLGNNNFPLGDNAILAMIVVVILIYILFIWLKTKFKSKVTDT